MRYKMNCKRIIICVFCWFSVLLETAAYAPIYVEGTDITHRTLRSVGPRRKQIKEELLTMLGIPSLWRHSRETRNLDASLERKYPDRNSDPTNNADSVFLLDTYNKITDSVMGTEMELSSLSKPALTIRKIRKTGKGIPSKTHLSNLRMVTDELIDESDKLVTIQDSNLGTSLNQNQGYETGLNFSVPEDDPSKLNVATLRIYKRTCDAELARQSGNQTFTLMVIESTPSNAGVFDLIEVSKLELTAYDVGWLELDVTATVAEWMHNPASNNGLTLKIIDQHGDAFPLQHAGIVGVEYESHLAPFMVLYHKNDDFVLQQYEVVAQRSKRAAKREQKSVREDSDYDYNDDYNESEDDSSRRSSRRKTTRSTIPGKKKKNGKGNRRKGNRKCSKKNGSCRKNPKKKLCSRDRLYLNFRELGWNHYIIAPEGYAAFRCRGECDLPLNPQLNATNHAIVQALVASMNSKLPKPCCAPVKLEQMTMVYHDEDNRVILRKYKEMVVKSCGCH